MFDLMKRHAVQVLKCTRAPVEKRTPTARVGRSEPRRYPGPPGVRVPCPRLTRPRRPAILRGDARSLFSHEGDLRELVPRRPFLERLGTVQRLYRGMRAEVDGKPECGSTHRTLGVLVPDDIAPDAQGRVHPGTGGMSVAPDDPMHLQPHRRPRALLGTGPDPVFVIDVSEIGATLAARQDRPGHALVEPSAPVELASYVLALHRTRLSWMEVS